MNPYTQGNPYTSQIADIGYPQVDYQSQMQDTRLQDQFQNNALNQMQQMGQQQPNWNPVSNNALALAMALRKMSDKPDSNAMQTWKSSYGSQYEPYTGEGMTVGATGPNSVFW